MFEAWLTGLLIAMLTVAVCLPLVPAVLIYKLFPRTKVWASGPLKGLTLNVQGAFAAYAIVFVLSLELTRPAVSTVGGFFRPSWQVEIPIVFHDKNGKSVDTGRLPPFTVVLSPELHRVGSDTVMIRIPGLRQEEWPSVSLQVANGWGARQLNLATLRKNLEIDSFGKVVRVTDPIEIKQWEGDAYDDSRGHLNAP